MKTTTTARERIMESLTLDQQETLRDLREQSRKARQLAKNKAIDAKEAKEAAEDAEARFFKFFDDVYKECPLLDRPTANGQPVVAESVTDDDEPTAPTDPDFNVDQEHPADHDPDDWRSAPVGILRTTGLSVPLINRLISIDVKTLGDLEKNMSANKGILRGPNLGAAKARKIEAAFEAFINGHNAVRDPELAPDSPEHADEGEMVDSEMEEA